MTGAAGGPSGVTLFDGADAGPKPRELAAATVKVYAVPLVNPLTVMEAHGALQEPVSPPGDEVAVYCVIGYPLLLDALNVTVACALPA